MQHEGTFADYFSMKEGDNIFFFIKRKIYGIGKFISVEGECKYLNFMNADEPKESSKEDYRNNKQLLPYANELKRCFCIFESNPFLKIREWIWMMRYQVIHRNLRCLELYGNYHL